MLEKFSFFILEWLIREIEKLEPRKLIGQQKAKERKTVQIIVKWISILRKKKISKKSLKIRNHQSNVMHLIRCYNLTDCMIRSSHIKHISFFCILNLIHLLHTLKSHNYSQMLMNFVFKLEISTQIGQHRRNRKHFWQLMLSWENCLSF